jgi:hypothetical protein
MADGHQLARSVGDAGVSATVPTAHRVVVQGFDGRIAFEEAERRRGS